MNKLTLSAFLMLAALSSFAQLKVFTFSQVEIRKDSQQWEKASKTTERTARFSSKFIDVKLEKNYHLNIIKTTHLPDHGVIYLCKDEKKKDVTVTLISNERMFLYDDKKRFLVNFDRPAVASNSRAMYADAD